MQLLEANIQRLHDAASTLSDSGGHTSAAILGTLATEEAAKVLILLDAVRCPSNRTDDRRRTLLRWNNHLWKGIYAGACNGKLFHQHFADVEKFVSDESALFYLDGPADYEWIFPNPILAKREQGMYVDYVVDLTDPVSAEPWWSGPYETEIEYRPSPCLRLVAELSSAGITTAAGLEVVAEVWRTFEPQSQTSVTDLGPYISRTLHELAARGISDGLVPVRRLANQFFGWPFPFWSLPGPTRGRKAQRAEILQEREARLEWIRKIEQVREPAPVISEQKVIQLQRAFDVYMVDYRKHEARFAIQRGGLRIIPAEMPSYDEAAAPYRELKRLWRALSPAEHLSLIALALFTHGQVANWSWAHRHAQWIAEHNDERYQIHLGGSWLEGLQRYQADPPKRD